MNIILCGFKSSGKTTVGQYLAKHCHCRFIDTDIWLRANFNATHDTDYTLPEIYRQVGEANFRALESRVVNQVVEAMCHAPSDTYTVVATGGGILMRLSNAKRLRAVGQLVYLYVHSAVLYQRVLGPQGQLPHFMHTGSVLANPQQAFQHHWQERAGHYAELSDSIIDATHKTPENIAVLISPYLKWPSHANPHKHHDD